MKVVRNLVVFAVVVFMSCQKSDHMLGLKSGLVVGASVVVDDWTRTYDYYIPKPGSAISFPLVFLLHGAGSSSQDLTGERGLKSPYKVWMELADKHQLILVYPNGTKGTHGGQGWNDCRLDATSNPEVDDVKFIETLIAELSATYAVAVGQIYATGTSNGGHLALRLAMQLPHKIAAVAAVAAAMPAEACQESKTPISVLFMNGSDDPLLPYGGGEVAAETGGRGTVLSSESSVDYWLHVNQMEGLFTIEDLPDKDRRDGSTVTKYSYTQGVGDKEVVLYQIVGGGHVEPSIAEQYSPVLERILGRQNHDMEMAEEIWSFFDRHSL